jgi:hypothetical protein
VSTEQSSLDPLENLEHKTIDELKQFNPNIINEENYGIKFHDHLIEEYKIYVEMMDRISSRRTQANQFYISLLSALFGIISIVFDKNLISSPSSIFLTLLSILGILICFVWHINIDSYKQLNSLKFEVIQEIEQMLPFACYSREWNILRNRKKRYIGLSEIEKYIPFAISTAFFGLFIYSIINK